MFIALCSLTEWLCTRRLLGVMLPGRQWRCILSKFQVAASAGVRSWYHTAKAQHEYILWGMKAAQCLDAPVSLSQFVSTKLTWRLHKALGEIWPSSKGHHISATPTAKAAVHAWLQCVCQKCIQWFQEAEKSLLPLEVCSRLVSS